MSLIATHWSAPFLPFCPSLLSCCEMVSLPPPLLLPFPLLTPFLSPLLLFWSQGRSADFAMRHILGLKSRTSPAKANALASASFSAVGQPTSNGNGAAPWLRCLHLNELPAWLSSGRVAYVTYAVGFDRRALPPITVDGETCEVPAGYEGYDVAGSGQLKVGPSASAKPLPSAFGTGLAFPHIDPSTPRKYAAASIPLFIQRATAIATQLGLDGSHVPVYHQSRL